jgi:hypothetical protein
MASSLLAGAIKRRPWPTAAAGPGRGRRPWRGAGPRPCQARPWRIPSSSSARTCALPEMEDLLHGVRVDLVRRPSGELLLRCSVRGLGFTKISRVRVLSLCRCPPNVAIGLVKLDDFVPKQTCRLCFQQPSTKVQFLHYKKYIIFFSLPATWL